MKSDCPGYQNLEEFADHELDSTRHEKLKHHFESCLKCRGKLEQLSFIKRITSAKITPQKAPICLKLSVVSMTSSSRYKEPAEDEASSLHSLGFSDAAIPAGTHICFFYESEQERGKIILDYLNAGIKGGESCFAALYDEKPDGLLDKLGDPGHKMPSELEQGQLIVYDSSRFYYPEGEFVPDNFINRLIQMSESASEKGYPILRGFGNASWLQERPAERTKIMECEHRVNEELFSICPIVAICMYDLRIFDDTFLSDILDKHPYFIYKGDFKRNPSFMCA